MQYLYTEAMHAIITTLENHYLFNLRRAVFHESGLLIFESTLDNTIATELMSTYIVIGFYDLHTFILLM